jgi:AraC family transcriptional regulator
MMPVPIPLFSNNDLQLYHARMQLQPGLRWTISKQYPVSLFFYLKGPAGSVNGVNTPVNRPFISKNKSQFLYHDKEPVVLQWEGTGAVEFVEMRMKKEWLATSIAREPKEWAAFFHLHSLPGNILIANMPLVLQKDHIHIINGIAGVSSRPPFLRPLLLEARALELIAAFVEQLQAPHLQGPALESHSKLALQAKKYIDSYKGKKQFTIISLAQSLDTNETTLKQAFKSTYGKTLFRYFQEKNMQAALKSLQAGKSVGDTAAQCGYSYISHFSVAFKKEFGVSPSRFI